MPIPFRPLDRRAARIRRRRALRGAGAALTLAAALVVPSVPADPSGDASLSPEASIATLSALSDRPDFGDDGTVPLATAGSLYVSDGGRSHVAEKGGRVAPNRLPAVQARFAAGSLGAVSGVLRPGMALGDREMRTALAGPRAFGEPFHVAQRFADPADTVRVAQATAKPMRSRVAVSVARERGVDTTAPSLGAMAAYAATVAPDAASLFDNVLKPKSDTGVFVPPIGGKDHAWAASTLPPSAYTKSEQTCLATGIYFEARGETEQGQAAVAQVILNRVRNPTYPDTICGVVYQNSNWRNRCQFSFACDGIKDVIWNRSAYQTAERIADDVTQGRTWIPEVGSATHYHATYVKPRWARAMEKVDKIGLHVFYRTFKGGWN